MDSFKLEFCCGVAEIGGFPYDPVSATELQADLDYYIKQAASATRGLILATTLAVAQHTVGEVLKERGFKETLHFRGREKEGSCEIILWTKVLKEV